MAHKRNQRKKHKKGLPPGSLVYTGHREEAPSLITTVLYGDLRYEEKSGYFPAADLLTSTEICWVDVRGLTETHWIERIGQDQNIHPLALEDVLDTQQRAKLEEFDNGLFFIVHKIKINGALLEFSSEQIALFMGTNLVISFQEDPDDTLAAVRKRAQEGLGRLRKKGSDYLMYAILDFVVDGYYGVLDDLEAQIVLLEEAIHHHESAETTKARMFLLKRTVSEFRHRLLPLREAVSRLHRSESDLVNENTRLYLRDLVDHVAQIMDSLDGQRDMLINLEALYQAEAANRLNNVMRLLTVISTIFIPLSFLAGVYGMNFDNMPELHWKYGYFGVLAVMFLATMGMLAYFIRKKWI